MRVSCHFQGWVYRERMNLYPQILGENWHKIRRFGWIPLNDLIYTHEILIFWDGFTWMFGIYPKDAKKAS